MKNLFLNSTILCIIITAAFMLTGCSGGAKSNDPVKIAQAYAEAYYKGDLEKCRDLMSPNYANSPLEDELESMEPGFADVMKKVLKEHQYKAKYNAEKSEVNETDAKIVFDISSGKIDIDESNFYFHFNGKRIDNDSYIDMEFEDGKWYVRRGYLYVDEQSRTELRKRLNLD